MRRFFLLLTLCTLLVGAGAAGASAGYRLHALVDVDGNPATGCVAAAGSGLADGHELRLVASADRTQVTETVLESCRDGNWRIDEREAAPQAIAAGQGLDGSDRIAWSVPRIWFEAHPRLQLRMLVERVDSGVVDLLAIDGQWMTLELTLGDVGVAIPALGLVGMLLMLATFAWFGMRRLRQDMGRVWIWLLAVLALLGHGWSQHEARASDPWVVEASAADAGNDVADAGADILHARVGSDSERVHFEVDVNDIEAAGLGEDAKVLFIGNSLTYSNDLPEMLEAIASQAGKRLDADMIALPNAALEDHFRARTAHSALANGGYQVVIMQQGPSSLPESQAHLLEWTVRFATRIRAGGAKPALYMVWPDITRTAYFDDVRYSYLNAALEVDGMFIPAGEAWRAAWRVDPALPLYDADQFHPSNLGSYAAALSIYTELYRQSPVGLSPRLQLGSGRILELDADQAHAVQVAAWTAHRQHGRAGR